MTTTAPPAAAAAANGPQMRLVLDQDIAKRSAIDTIKAVPARAREYVASTLKTLHLDGLGENATSLGRWIMGRMATAGRFLKGFGLHNIAALFITTPLRHTVVSVVRTTYRVVTAPLRWIGRAIAWGLNQFGLGRSIVERVQNTVTLAETWVSTKVSKVLTWLDERNNSGVMSWIRWLSQTSMVSKVIRLAFPMIPTWVLYLVALPFPVYGDQYSPEEETAIANAKQMLGDVPSRPHVVKDIHDRANEKAAPIPANSLVIGRSLMTDISRPAGKQAFEVNSFKDEKGELWVRLAPEPEGLYHVDDLPEGVVYAGIAPMPKGAPRTMLIETFALTDTRLPAEGQGFEAVGFLDDRGEQRIRFQGQLLHVKDLPDEVSIAGKIQGPGDQVMVPHPDDVTATVRSAQAKPGGRPPTLPPRGGRRATPVGKR